MTGKGIKYIIALLNTNFITYIFKKFYAGGGLGENGYRYKKAFLENLPVPQLSATEQQPFIDLVEKILQGKEQGEDTTKYEKQIDRLVYQLYELTEEEIKMIENGTK